MRTAFRVDAAPRLRVDAFLADSVSARAGTLDAQAAGWNVLYAEALPTVVGRIGLGLIVRIPAAGGGAPHELEVRLEDPAGEEVALVPAAPGAPPGARRLRGRFALDAPPAGADLDELLVTAGVNVDAVPIAAPGRHRFVVAVDGADVTAAAFTVLHRRAPTGGGAPAVA